MCPPASSFGITALTDALGVTLTYSENNAAIALCDTGLYHVTRRGTVDVLLELSSQDLIATASQGSTMAVAVRSYLNDARSDLYTVRNGSLHGPFALTEEPTALAVSNAGHGGAVRVRCYGLQHLCRAAVAQ